MKLIIASDHAGFELKSRVKDFLIKKGYAIDDMGAHSFNNNDDYPEIMIPVAMKILSEQDEKNEIKAIIFGKSGQGEAMVVNRFPGIHATVYYNNNLEIIRLAREHNDSNVLSIGAGFVTFDEAIEAIELWISTEFTNEERHKRRLEHSDNIE